MFCIYSVKRPQYSVLEVVGRAEIITIEGYFSCFSVTWLMLDLIPDSVLSRCATVVFQNCLPYRWSLKDKECKCKCAGVSEVSQLKHVSCKMLAKFKFHGHKQRILVP